MRATGPTSAELSDRREEILAALQQRPDVHYLAGTLGVTAPRLRRFLRAWGIRPPTRGDARRRRDGLQHCCICKLDLPLTAFYTDRRRWNGAATRCRGCWPKYQNTQRVFQSYGLTLADFQVLLAAQGGVCAICKRAATPGTDGKLRRLHLDHCHKTGALRGILCSQCNTALGLFRDSPDLLQTATTYLLKAMEDNCVTQTSR